MLGLLMSNEVYL